MGYQEMGESSIFNLFDFNAAYGVKGRRLMSTELGMVAETGVWWCNLKGWWPLGFQGERVFKGLNENL